MVGGAPQVLEQPSVPQTLTSEEEEAVKRNTDCVYFLASPLTCKKGSECEYRHSEYARVNPRDCWFWLNGNCLNLKCGFRHPPLDGLVGGTHTANPASSQIPSQPSSIPSASTHNPFNSSKQAVPCVFFQKGMCLKGDRCAFLHGPPPASTNKVPQAPANAQAGDFPSLKKVSGGIQRCSQEQKIAQANFSKSIGAPPKLTSKDEIMASKTGNNNGKSEPATEVDDGGSKYKATNSYPILNESSFSRTNRLQQSHVPEDRGLQNGKDVDEFKESSPGFDVLVDDELRGSGYYGGEETYGRTRGHEGTNMISMNEYDMNHSVDYKMISDIDQDIYNNELVDYDYDSRQQRQYGWEHHRSSSEKLSLESTHMESRRFRKSNSPERVQNMDLRLRLNKHRRGNGLRSTINNETAASRPVEERNYRASRRDSQESSVSSRLHGRIKLPRIPSPVRNNNLPPERDLNRGRNWGRSSPGRSQSSSYLGSVRDEIKGRVEEDHNNERRNFNGFSSSRDRMDGTFHFAAPKSLAELKGEKPLVSKEQQTLGKRKGLEEDNEQFGSEVSFKGPKSLSEILKKKRQVEAAVKLPVNNADRENRERLIEHSVTPIMKQSGLSSTAKQEADSLILSQEGTKSAPAETAGTEEEKIIVSHNQSSQVIHSTDHENEDGMAYDETLEEEHEYEEADDQREGEYEYEQGDDGEYNYEEGDNNVYPEEDEYMDDEDGDDFAKKIGVMS